MNAFQSGFEILTASVYDGDYVNVFFPPRLRCAFQRLFVCFSVIRFRALFEEFLLLKEQLWRGRFWSEGYAVRTAGVVTSAKIE